MTQRLPIHTHYAVLLDELDIKIAITETAYIFGEHIKILELCSLFKLKSEITKNKDKWLRLLQESQYIAED